MAEGKQKKRIGALLSYIVFGALASLIIAESAIPSGPSGTQSFGLSALIASFINAVTPGKKVIEAYPDSLSVSSSISTYHLEEGGEALKLFEDDEAIVGTTRLFNYKLTYNTEGATVFHSSVTLDVLSSPGEGSFSKTLTASTKSGQVRLIPLIPGSYSFALSDEGGNRQEFSFTAKERIAPKSILLAEDGFTVNIGDAKAIPFSLYAGDMTRSDTSVDHYLARYWNPDLTEFSSSDESIFTVEKGFVKGVAAGNANLLWKEQVVGEVNVASPSSYNDIARIELSLDDPTVSPLDYDYVGYGKQIQVRYFNAADEELHFQEEPSLRYESSDSLVAMIRNDHYEDSKDGPLAVKGGFVMGYRNLGKATIKAILPQNPAIFSEIEVESKRVNPTSVTISITSGGKKIADGATLTSGNSIAVSASFQPVNCANKEIHVECSPADIATISNNNSSSPSVALIGDGNLTISIHSVVLGEDSKVVYNLKVNPRPTIDKKDMSDFASFVRKFIGHFTLFLVFGLFGALSFCLTLFSDKKYGLSLSAACSLSPGLLVAFLSEAIQSIPALKRGASMLDIGIDFLGYVIGVLLVYLIFLLVKVIRSRLKAREE